MTHLDFTRLREALEQRNAHQLIGLYAEDAEIQVINQNTPPSRPFEAKGRAEVDAYLTELCERDVTHEVHHQVFGDDRIAFTETCRYPDGSKVVASHTLELDDGKIARQLTLETWDG